MRSLDYYTNAERVKNKAVSDFSKGRISLKNLTSKVKKYFKVEQERLRDAFEELVLIKSKMQDNYTIN